MWDPRHLIDYTFFVLKEGERLIDLKHGITVRENEDSHLKLKALDLETLGERRIRNKLIYFQKARLQLIDMRPEHLRLNIRRNRLGGDDPVYMRRLSAIGDNRISSLSSRTVTIFAATFLSMYRACSCKTYIFLVVIKLLLPYELSSKELTHNRDVSQSYLYVMLI